MNKKNLILAVQNADYTERLADYIRHSTFGESWQLTVFTNPAALIRFIRGGYTIDLLAVDVELLGELGELAEGLPIVVLGDGAQGSADGGRRARAAHEVLMVQPLPQLLQALTAAFAAYGGIAVQSRNSGGDEGEVTVAAVYSASGGIGKTTLAHQLCQLAAISGARVFYLNLEQWNSSVLGEGAEGGEDLAQLLYTVQTEPERAALQLTALRKRHVAFGVDYIAPCGNAEERLSLTAEHVSKLVEVIKATGEYDVIVADLDSRMDPMHIGVFGASQHVLWLVSRHPVGMRKLELAKAYGEQKYGDAFRQLRSKLHMVEVGNGGELPYVSELADGGAGTSAYRGAVEALMGRLGIGGEHRGRSNRTAAQGANPRPA
ncbi:CobQ/CobB/MinD/ParA nucleotide binding domain-containing protein [Paenibacillus taihuensis]|uniref:CobQ/CobB/MinD/ParA nucleotide binding domain-containing protein n=1 Tax=Paenibacillus taihuensis TaxID=1156355 RepID=A0A3D9QU21_9BACL|nr:hypothetical protein [Paenibacillus taihuensis]REE67271.1 CobQ/CobB/MinD/ParA nucleotide binding domain-containing protein [Paenibacillus taihuensis]